MRRCTPNQRPSGNDHARIELLATAHIMNADGLARPAGETGRMRRAAGSEEDQLYRGDHPDRGDEDPQRERR